MSSANNLVFRERIKHPQAWPVDKYLQVAAEVLTPYFSQNMLCLLRYWNSWRNGTPPQIQNKFLLNACKFKWSSV